MQRSLGLLAQSALSRPLPAAHLTASRPDDEEGTNGLRGDRHQ